MKKSISLSLAVLAFAAAASFGAAAQSETETTARLVVKFREGPLELNSGAGRRQALDASKVAGTSLSVVRNTASGATVYALPAAVTLLQARDIARRLALDPRVKSAEPDVRVKMQVEPVPNDAVSATQWNLRDPLSGPVGGANLFRASAMAAGARVVVAVVDSGVLPHPDLVSGLLPGYDMFSDAASANDGDGRDNDATDPGDYCDPNGVGGGSSWHGLKVASLIGAQTNNGIGIAGATSNVAMVLPVRALGCGGGWMSDIMDAVLWASGVPVAGAPSNANPARVINLSLSGTPGAGCPGFMQDAVDVATARGVVITAAAGNHGSSTDIAAPASCAGVIAVGAHTRSGDLAAYSNTSSRVTLTAPGGGVCRSQVATCDSTGTAALDNSGFTLAGAYRDFGPFAGTSAATPHVSAAAALLVAVKPDLTPAEVRSALVSAARAPVAGSYCALNPGKCGGGMLDATAAVMQVSAPLLTLTQPRKSVASAAVVNLSVSASGASGPYTYTWTQKTGETVTLSGQGTNAVSFVAPNAKGVVAFDIEVGSALGNAARDTITVSVNNAPVLTLPERVALAHNTTLSLPVSVADADGDSVAVAILEGPEGASIEGGMLTWLRPAAGVAKFVLIAGDGDLDSSPVTVYVDVAAAPAPVEGTPPSGGTGGQSPGGSAGGDTGGGSSSSLFVALMALAVGALCRTRGAASVTMPTKSRSPD